MNYNFYATESDKVEILDFIFEETNLLIYDSYSEYEKEICIYKSTAEIQAKFDLATLYPGKTFKLWSQDFRAQPYIRKVDLDPKRCNGYTFRYATNGWGLIQLYLNGIKQDALYYSHMGHFSERGALARENLGDPIYGSMAKDWNWKAIQQLSRKLKTHIHSQAIAEHTNGLDILKDAAKLCNSGIILAH